MSDKIYLGKLGKSVGLKGELKVYLDTDFPQAIKKNSTLLTNKNILLEVERFDINRGIIKFTSYDDCDTAKKLTNLELFTTKEDSKELCKLKDGEYFWFDIISCSVYEDDLLLGIVDDIHRFPLGDYLEIKVDNSLVEKNLPKVFLIPYIQKTYILNVNLKDKLIHTTNALAILENS